VELIEMSKEKIYIQNDNKFEINEKYINPYIKSIINILRRNKNNDNDYIIEKSLIEIIEINNIPSKDNSNHLGNILIDNYLREIKEEPNTKKNKNSLNSGTNTKIRPK